MCGIAGLLDPHSGPDRLREIAAAMTASLQHRGPDDGDVWADTAGIALGQRRLSIIDLSPLGRQPMASHSGRYMLTYNGEIYNFQALRRELEAAGVPFRGHSDTEVMLAGIEAWGLEPCLARLQGMFALALWDHETRTLSLARDRVGIKPLYWYPVGTEGIAFASETRAFHYLPGFEKRLDATAVSDYLRFNYIPTPRSIWQGLRKLPPGGLLIKRPDAAPEERLYWTLDQAIAAEPAVTSDTEATQRLHELLRDAVRDHMISDVPLGAFLSGGIDSSLVAALMQSQSARPVKTFTIGYTESGYDESQAAEAVAKHLGCEHTTLTVTPAEALEVIPGLASIYDEPFADASQIPTYLVARLTRRHVTVALSGDGGDEGFAGYNRHVMAPAWQNYAAWPAPLRQGLAGALRLLSPSQWDSAAGLLPASLRPPQFGEKLHKLAGTLQAESLEQYYRPLVEQWPDAAVLLQQPGAVPPLAKRHKAEDIVAYLQRLDAGTYLHDDVLTKVDRATMAVALEARVPLLDHRVLSFGLALPRNIKLRDGKGKWLLRHLLGRYVPPELFERPKSGFAVPIGTWLRGPLRDWAEDLLSEAALNETGLLRATPIRQAWQDHLSGRANRQYGLWGVLMLQAWQRQWLKA
ncbi:asparagine synthase (glutamine-hydrolyzing) [Ferrovibrio sp. MS7]|jgi:asparagine synthase (glutamine-hydrolysing)|uniref:asparagine synthase (glutamine-hydrolyzing) n=1 Tax=Ferrovibrio plantarum TaxID=3119164 RepID=UPI003136FE5C